MRRQRRSIKLLALIAGLSLIAGACGGDDDDEGAADDTGAAEEGEPTQGGEVIDLGTFVGDPPEYLDPALNSTLDAYQAVNALYDGLTDIDSTDPENPVVVPQVAESFEPNEDATVWTFQIREGLSFSNGEQVLPSSFQLAWERASDPALAGDYSYLFNFIDGGAEKLDGAAPTLSGVAVDDDAMTLTVTLDAPVLQLPEPGQLPDLLPDADGRRGDRGPDPVGPGHDGRQRAVHARDRAQRHRDRARARTPSGTARCTPSRTCPSSPTSTGSRSA